MISPEADDALAVLMKALTEQPELEEAVHERWRSRGGRLATATALPPDLIKVADTLNNALAALAKPGQDVKPLAQGFKESSAPVLLLWCYASTWHRDIELAPILSLAAKQQELRERVAAVASSRVLEGPLLD